MVLCPTDEILAALGSVVGRKHPSSAQAKQLKQCLPLVSVVLQVLTSQVSLPRLRLRVRSQKDTWEGMFSA